MQNSHSPKKRGRSVLWDARLAMTALAVGGTIGFWNLFSTQMMKERAATVQQPVDPTPEAIAAPQVVEINLPPMPTLVPSVSTQSALASNLNPIQPSVNTPTSVNVPPQPSFQTGTKLLLGGSSPQAGGASIQVRRSAPAPVARTRSSRP